MNSNRSHFKSFESTRRLCYSLGIVLTRAETKNNTIRAQYIGSFDLKHEGPEQTGQLVSLLRYCGTVDRKSYVSPRSAVNTVARYGDISIDQRSTKEEENDGNTMCC